MTGVRTVPCPNCDTRSLLPIHELHVVQADDGWWLEWVCLDCGHVVGRRFGDERHARRLLNDGASFERRLPAKAPDSPLGWDDVLDFHLALRHGDYLGAVLEYETRD